MKVRNKTEKLKATHIFTDREEPRKAFWNNYEKVKESLHNNGDSHVLQYYGIGGIGKSSLLDELSKEMKEKLKTPRFAMFDFSRKQDMRSVLESLRNQLQDKYNFDFHGFDYGLYTYAKKAGEDMKEPQMRSFVDRSPALSCILETMGAIPTVNILSQLAKATDKAVVLIYDTLNSQKQEMAKIESMEVAELYQYLVHLFSSDLDENMKNQKEPLVIMFDTYECLVNEMALVGEPLNNDLWIRGDEGLIQNVHDVLWVIAGREKLKWERFDSDWKDSLETHLLGDLDGKDATDFLKDSGISNSELRDELYNLTHGTPVYLDICVNQYLMLLANGKTPNIDDFGKDVYSLIERFARYMDDSKKDIVYVLSCLGLWNDEIAIKILSQVLPGFSLTSYEKVKDFSFINKMDDGLYAIHQIVGDILYGHCGKSLKTRTVIQAVTAYREILEDINVYSKDCVFYIKQYLKFLLSAYKDDNGLNNALDGRVVFLLDALSEIGRFKEIEGSFEAYIKRAEQSDDKEFCINVFDAYTTMLFNNRDYEKACEYSKKAFEFSRDYYGEKDIQTLLSQENYGLSLRKINRVEESIRHISDALAVLRTEFGEDDYRTLGAKHSLANSLSAVGRHDDAFEYLAEVAEKYDELYGLKNEDTLRAYCDCASVLADLEQFKDAVEMYATIVEVAVELFGDAAPITLSIVGNWASILDDYGDYERAKNINADLLEEYVELYGEYHPNTLDIKNNYANNLEHLGLYSEAETIMISILENYELLYGEKNPNTIRGMNNLAFLYHLENRPDKGLPIALKMKPFLNENIIKDPSVVIDYENTLVCLYIDSGEFGKAVELGTDLVKRAKEHYPDYHKLLAELCESTALALFKLSNYEAALEYAQESLRYLQGIQLLDTQKLEKAEQLINDIKSSQWTVTNFS